MADSAQEEANECGTKRPEAPKMEDASPECSSGSGTAGCDPPTKVTGVVECPASTPLSAPAPKRRRRNRLSSSSTTPTPSAATPLPIKPLLTERQQLALAMQLSSPLASPRSHTVQDPPPTSQGKSKFSKRNDRGETMLHCACIRGDLKAVVSSVEGGSDVQALDNANWTPLHEAANHGHVDIVSYLLEHGADIHAPGHDKTTPLLDAVYGGHYEVVALLIKNDADPNMANAKGVTPMQVAKNDEDDRMVAILSGDKDPGEASSPKSTPRKSQQFAKHEKRETPKKTSQYAKSEESLVVSVPLRKVRSVKTRLKFDHISSDKEGVKPNVEEVKPLDEEEGSVSIEDEEDPLLEGGQEMDRARDKEEPAAKGSGTEAEKADSASGKEEKNSASLEHSSQLEHGEEEEVDKAEVEERSSTEELASHSTEGSVEAEEEKQSIDESRGRDVCAPGEMPPSPSPPPVGQSKESKVVTDKDEMTPDLQCSESCDPGVTVTPKREKEADKAKENETTKEDSSNNSKPKMRSPPPPPLTLSLPPDHTYCGPAVPGRTPPPRPTLSHNSRVITPTSGYSTPLDCLLQAAEGSMYLSSSPLSAGSHKGSTMLKSAPKIVSPQKSSPTPKAPNAASPMSFPVSLSFSKYNLPYPRSAPPTPSVSAVNPLFSLATIATSPPLMSSTSSTSRTLKVRPSSIPSPVTRSAPRQDSTLSRLRDKGKDTKVDCQDEMSLPPKKRHRSVFRSEVVAQRQQCRPTVLPSRCQLDQFITITGSYPSKVLMQQPPTDPASVSPRLPRGLVHLFVSQEEERRRVRVRHLVEQERLQMHLEGELVRAHSKVQGCPQPPTVCQYITEHLRGWQSCVASDSSDANTKPSQEEKQVAGSESEAEEQRRMKLLHSCVVDVWDKAYAMKVGMSRRHKEEALVLFNSQKMSWLVAAEELGDHHLYADQHILNLHVPKLTVSAW